MEIARLRLAPSAGVRPQAARGTRPVCVRRDRDDVRAGARAVRVGVAGPVVLL